MTKCCQHIYYRLVVYLELYPFFAPILCEMNANMFPSLCKILLNKYKQDIIFNFYSLYQSQPIKLLSSKEMDMALSKSKVGDHSRG